MLKFLRHLTTLTHVVATAGQKTFGAICGLGFAAFLAWHAGHHDASTNQAQPDTSITSTAPTASAGSDMDAKFIQVLDVGNIPYKSPQNAIILAHLACTDLRDGTYWTTMNTVTAMNPSWTDFQDGYVVGVAADAYCPDQKSKIPTVQ